MIENIFENVKVDCKKKAKINICEINCARLVREFPNIPVIYMYSKRDEFVNCSDSMEIFKNLRTDFKLFVDCQVKHNESRTDEKIKRVFCLLKELNSKKQKKLLRLKNKIRFKKGDGRKNSNRKNSYNIPLKLNSKKQSNFKNQRKKNMSLGDLKNIKEKGMRIKPKSPTKDKKSKYNVNKKKIYQTRQKSETLSKRKHRVKAKSTNKMNHLSKPPKLLNYPVFKEKNLQISFLQKMKLNKVKKIPEINKSFLSDKYKTFNGYKKYQNVQQPERNHYDNLKKNQNLLDLSNKIIPNQFLCDSTQRISENQNNFRIKVQEDEKNYYSVASHANNMNLLKNENSEIQSHRTLGMNSKIAILEGMKSELRMLKVPQTHTMNFIKKDKSNKKLYSMGSEGMKVYPAQQQKQNDFIRQRNQMTTLDNKLQEKKFNTLKMKVLRPQKSIQLISKVNQSPDQKTAKPYFTNRTSSALRSSKDRINNTVISLRDQVRNKQIESEQKLQTENFHNIKVVKNERNTSFQVNSTATGITEQISQNYEPGVNTTYLNDVSFTSENTQLHFNYQDPISNLENKTRPISYNSKYKEVRSMSNNSHKPISNKSISLQNNSFVNNKKIAEDQFDNTNIISKEKIPKKLQFQALYQVKPSNQMRPNLFLKKPKENISINNPRDFSPKENLSANNNSNLRQFSHSPDYISSTSRANQNKKVTISRFGVNTENSHNYSPVSNKNVDIRAKSKSEKVKDPYAMTNIEIYNDLRTRTQTQGRYKNELYYNIMHNNKSHNADLKKILFLDLNKTGDAKDKEAVTFRAVSTPKKTSNYNSLDKNFSTVNPDLNNQPKKGQNRFRNYTPDINHNSLSKNSHQHFPQFYRKEISGNLSFNAPIKQYVKKDNLKASIMHQAGKLKKSKSSLNMFRLDKIQETPNRINITKIISTYKKNRNKDRETAEQKLHKISNPSMINSKTIL